MENLLHLRVSSMKVYRLLWLLVAFTYPMLGVDFLRVNELPLRVHVAYPTLLLGVVLAIGALLVFSKGGRVPRALLGGKSGQSLIGVAFLFGLWHILDMGRSGDLPLALREVMKLFFGIACIVTILLFFPRDRRFLERFRTNAVWTSSFFFLYLIYKYLIVFKSAFLGSTLDQETRAGRNHMAAYLVYIVPFALAYLWNSRHKYIAFVPVVILSGALMYVASRSALVSILIGLLFLAPLLGRAYGLRSILGFIGGIAAVCGIAFWGLSRFISMQKLEFIARFYYLINPASAPEFDTYTVRSEFIHRGWDLFATSPLFGLGLVNTPYQPHNDYIRILSDLGIIGWLLFIATLFCVFLCVRPRRLGLKSGQQISWVTLASRAAVVGSLFILGTADRVYTKADFWMMVGLALLAFEIERGAAGHVSYNRTKIIGQGGWNQQNER